MMKILAFGVTGYLHRLIITPSGLGGAGVITPFHIPDGVANLPLLGPVLVMSFDQGPIAMSVLFIVNVILGCGLAGLAGAHLTLESTGSFQNGMTGGRGFIALAAMIFGRGLRSARSAALFSLGP